MSSDRPDETASSSDDSVSHDPDGAPRPAAPLQTRDPARYAVLAEHGRGGIGRVLRATDREFGRDVALKELLVRTSTSERRFLREALITARLEHPNIVPVHEAGRWPDGTPFYAMKLVSGRPLRALIEEARTDADRLALLPRVLAVVDAIAYAHDRGIIHRDLKPSNVIVGDYGETIVIDWGLARYVDDPADDTAAGSGEAVDPMSPLTVAGTVLGTPAFMPPEQAAGTAADQRSDVYALGAIVKEIFAPPARTDVTTVTDGTTTWRGIDRTTGMPADLASIVAKAMAVDPAARYPTAQAFGDDLRRFLAGQIVQAHRYRLRERTARWISAHRRLVQGAAAVLVVLLATSVVFLIRESGLRTSEQDARHTAEAARVAAEQARRTAESERDRADRQTLTLLEQQGRSELAAGHPFRAAPLLAEAYRRAPDNRPIRWLLTEAMHALDALALHFDAKPPPPSDPQRMVDSYAYSIGFSPDDRQLVTGHLTGVAVWDATTGALVHRWPMSTHGHLATFRSDGTALLTADAEGGAHVVDVATGLERTPIPPRDDLMTQAWSEDGRWLARSDEEANVEVWALEPVPARRFAFRAMVDAVPALAFTADGTLLGSKGTAEAIMASPRTATIARRLPTPGETIGHVGFSGDGRLFATSLQDGTVRLWNVATGLPTGRLRSHAATPYSLALDGDGVVLATVDSDALYVWDASSAVQLLALDPPRRIGAKFARNVAFAHGGHRIAEVTFDAQVYVWDLPPDRWARPLPGHGRLVFGRFLGDGDTAMTLDSGGTVRVWNVDEGRSIRSFAVGQLPAWVSLAVDRAGDRMAFQAAGEPPRIFDLSTGRAVVSLDTEEEVRGVAFSPDGKALATASQQGYVRLWSAADGKALGLSIREPRGRSFNSVDFSPDGSQLLTAGRNPARIWDARTGALVRELPLDTRAAVADYSADGRRVVTGGVEDFVARILDPASGRTTAELVGHRGGIVDVEFSRDGTLVATCGADRIARIWETTTGALLRTIEGPRSSVEFSADGKHLLTTGNNYAVIWNVEVDPRSPAEISRVVAARSPWQLVDGKLVLKER